MENLLELLDRDVLESDKDYAYTRSWLSANNLLDCKRFVCFDKDKHPISAKTGTFASLMNPNDFATFDYCKAYWEMNSIQIVGIGIVCGLDNENRNIIGIDIENACEDIEEALDIVKGFKGYKEISASLYGIHLLMFASESEVHTKKADNLKILGTGDFMALTGIKLEKSANIDQITDQTVAFVEFYHDHFYVPQIDEVMAIDETSNPLINIRIKKKNLSPQATRYIEILKQRSELFREMFAGNWMKYTTEIEEADEMFCQELAFYTSKNSEVMNEIYMASPLYRPVWNDFSLGYNYGQKVLNNAIQQTPLCWSEDFSIVAPSDIQETKVEDLVSYDDKKDYDLNDTGNARRFASYFSSIVKYDYQARVFAIFRNNKWNYDNPQSLYTLQIFDKFTDYLKLDMVNEKDDEIRKQKRKNVESLYSHANKSNVIDEIKHQPEMEIDTNAFDKYDTFINTPTEIVDIKTGEIFPCEKQYLQMRRAGCIYSYKEPKLWKKFLEETFGTETMWVRKYIAYCFAGLTNEQIFLCIYGKGNNGKSVFTKTIVKVFGDYAQFVPIGLFCDKKLDHQDQLMDTLKSTRLVVASEPEHAVEIKGAFVKDWVSGGMMSARKLYGAPYTYKAKSKIIIESNTKPIVREDSDGFYRRVRFIHCKNNVPESKIDTELESKLEKELPQIFGMIVQDYKLYLEQGLEQTQDMKDIQRNYIKSNSSIQDFLESRTYEELKGRTMKKDLYESYRLHCEEFDIDYQQRYTKGKFYMIMSDRYDVKRFSDGEYFVGIKLKKTENGKVLPDEMQDYYEEEEE